MAGKFLDRLRKGSASTENKSSSSTRGDFGANADGTCKPKPDIFRPDAAWQPKFASRRVELMITGTLSRVAYVRSSVTALQTQLFQSTLREKQLELRVTAFLDGCRHSTPWSTSPVDVGANTQRWHCYQGQTLFAQALEQSSKEEMIDAIIIYGDRFDDNLNTTIKQAEKLRAQGTRIFAFHVGANAASRNAYERVADHTGGVCLQLTDDKSFGEVMPVITDYLFRREQALVALPAPSNPDVKLLVDRLKAQPPANKK